MDSVLMPGEGAQFPAARCIPKLERLVPLALASVRPSGEKATEVT